MSDATFTFRVDSSLKEKFTEAVTRRDRTAAQLMRGFMRDFISQDEEKIRNQWFRSQVETGVQEADTGYTVSAEEVEAEAESWRSELQQQIKDGIE